MITIEQHIDPGEMLATPNTCTTITAREHILHVRGCMDCHAVTLDRKELDRSLLCDAHRDEWISMNGPSDGEVLFQLTVISITGCRNIYYHSRCDNPPAFVPYRYRKVEEMYEFKLERTWNAIVCRGEKYGPLVRVRKQWDR